MQHLTAPEIDQPSVLEKLHSDGVVVLGQLLDSESVLAMQSVYQQSLKHPTWNTWIGYERNEKWRKIVENLLLYDQAFVDLATCEAVTDIIRQYVGVDVELVEARGWETIATKADFHGWHADEWYSRSASPRPREVKLGCYLTDVETGHFQYVAGSHNSDEYPRHYSKREVAELEDRIVNMKGPAGTCFLFDTSGVHRQSSPVLKKRWVVMYNYHDPAATLAKEHQSFGRYRSILLNSSLIGGLSKGQQKILGIGSRHAKPDFQPKNRRFPYLHSTNSALLTARVNILRFSNRIREIKAGAIRRLDNLVSKSP